MKNSESGNAIFYIFIAIALLGALSFAVSQGTRGGGKALSDDRIHLAASEVIAYADAVAKSVGQMRLRGTATTALRFPYTGTDAGYGVYNAVPSSEIFNPQGGTVIYKSPPALALANPLAVYHFTGNNEIENVGSTCGDDECADLLMVLQGVSVEVCQRINEVMGFATMADLPPVDLEIAIAPYYAGTFDYTETVGDEAGSSILAGKTAGCFNDANSSTYVFYQVLVAR